MRMLGATMPLRKWKSLVKFAVLGNILVFAYFCLTLSSNNTPAARNGKAKSVIEKSSPVTIVYPDFEFFHHNLKPSVASVSDHLKGSHVLIVADSEPYPPLQLEAEHVKVIATDLNPLVPRHGKDPISYIKTKYTAFFPDNAIVKTAMGIDPILQYAAKHQGFDALVLPFGPGSHSKDCQALEFDVRRWSLSYSKAAEATGTLQKSCQAIETNVVIFMESHRLHELAEPFSHPFREGFFIQAALRNWTLLRLDGNHLFEQHNRMFDTDHLRQKFALKKNARQMKLYERFGVKKISHIDGTVKFVGCSKMTPRCFGTIINDMPEFIFQGKWTPPCCIRNLQATARHVFEIFDEYGVKYWLEGGSLLGAARHKDIIPWDYDVDLGMYQQDIENLEPLRLAQLNGRYEDPEQFVWTKAVEGEFFRVHFSQINHLHVDIFPFFEKDGIMTKNTWFKTHRQDTEFPAHYLKPLERMEFIGVKALVPNNHISFLELKFGKGVVEHPRYPNSVSVG